RTAARKSACDGMASPLGFGRQLLDADVLVERLRLRPAVDLQANDAAALDLVVLLRVVHRQRAVQPQPDARPLAADDVLVPVVVLDQLLYDGLFRLGQDLVAP